MTGPKGSAKVVCVAARLEEQARQRERDGTIHSKGGGTFIQQQLLPQTNGPFKQSAKVQFFDRRSPSSQPTNVYYALVPLFRRSPIQPAPSVGLACAGDVFFGEPLVCVSFARRSGDTTVAFSIV